jgi:NAD(P)H dehydrogenase (quinone)
MFFTRTGHTRKVAEAVAEGVREIEQAVPVLREAHEVAQEDMLSASAIVAGSPVYYGSMAAELKTVFDRFVTIREHLEGKVGAAFSTSGDRVGGAETTLLSILQAMLINGMVIVGDPMDATGHYGVACVGEPDEAKLDHARKLGRRVAELAKRLEV